MRGSAQALHGQHIADGAAENKAQGTDQGRIHQQTGRDPGKGQDVGLGLAARVGRMAKTTAACFPDQQGTADTQHHCADPGQEIGTDAAVAGVRRNLQCAKGQSRSNQQHACTDNGLRSLGRYVGALRLVGVCIGRNLCGLRCPGQILEGIRHDECV
ncbi:hypothetical protein SDC9_196764 [bioreactor metagenome]|uniref:Uncharacterized protein n=1 Tax=bioreactor metagenome TaxID=1076179 RepID=A0A645IDE2_9ZZZZ